MHRRLSLITIRKVMNQIRTGLTDMGGDLGPQVKAICAASFHMQPLVTRYIQVYLTRGLQRRASKLTVGAKSLRLLPLLLFHQRTQVRFRYCSL